MMRASWPRFRSALLKPATTSPSPPVCASGVHSEAMKTMRLPVGFGSSGGGGGSAFFALGADLSIAFAADSEAFAIRASATGDIVSGSALLVAGAGSFGAAADFDVVFVRGRNLAFGLVGAVFDDGGAFRFGMEAVAGDAGRMEAGIVGAGLVSTGGGIEAGLTAGALRLVSTRLTRGVTLGGR